MRNAEMRLELRQSASSIQATYLVLSPTKFVAAGDAQDKEFVFDGISVLVDARSLVYVAGMMLDYSSRMVNSGFQFSNPKAKRSCGCGTSFSV
jgi:iron-sulfur cluster assembly protein